MRIGFGSRVPYILEISGNTRTTCNHDGTKVYSIAVLMSNPPIRMWICKTCLEEGSEADRISLPVSLYDQLKREKAERSL